VTLNDTNTVAPAVPTARRDFGWLWAGQSLNLFGDQFMVLALPLLAVLVLHTSPAMAILLPFALYVPFLVLGLPAGAIIERIRRRTTMIVCNALQMLLFGLVWLLAYLQLLSFPVLALLVVLNGCAVVFFQVAYTTYLPGLLVEVERLHVGNSRLALSESSSQTVGPMVAGPVIQGLGVITAIAADAVSFAVALLTLTRIRYREPAPVKQPCAKGWMRRDIGTGLRFVTSHPILQPVFACEAVYVVFLSMIETSLVLYCLHVLHLSPQWIGVVTGAAAAGYPVGNLYTIRLRRRLGAHRALLAAAAVSVTGIVLMPVMGTIGGQVGVIGLVLGSIVHCVGEGAYGPISLTLRQTESPPTLLSRVGSVQRFLIWGAIAIGSLLASGVTVVLGLSGAMWVGAIGTVLCLPTLFRRGMRLAVLTGPSAAAAG
jgi:MFS family permease